jgi:hypothetical protein
MNASIVCALCAIDDVREVVDRLRQLWREFLCAGDGRQQQHHESGARRDLAIFVVNAMYPRSAPAVRPPRDIRGRAAQRLPL